MIRELAFLYRGNWRRFLCVLERLRLVDFPAVKLERLMDGFVVSDDPHENMAIAYAGMYWSMYSGFKLSEACLKRWVERLIGAWPATHSALVFALRWWPVADHGFELASIVEKSLSDKALTVSDFANLSGRDILKLLQAARLNPGIVKVAHHTAQRVLRWSRVKQAVEDYADLTEYWVRGMIGPMKNIIEQKKFDLYNIIKFIKFITENYESLHPTEKKKLGRYAKIYVKKYKEHPESNRLVKICIEYFMEYFLGYERIYNLDSTSTKNKEIEELVCSLVCLKYRAGYEEFAKEFKRIKDEIIASNRKDYADFLDYIILHIKNEKFSLNEFLKNKTSKYFHDAFIFMCNFIFDGGRLRKIIKEGVDFYIYSGNYDYINEKEYIKEISKIYVSFVDPIIEDEEDFINFILKKFKRNNDRLLAFCDSIVDFGAVSEECKFEVLNHFIEKIKKNSKIKNYLSSADIINITKLYRRTSIFNKFEDFKDIEEFIRVPLILSNRMRFIMDRLISLNIMENIEIKYTGFQLLDRENCVRLINYINSIYYEKKKSRSLMAKYLAFIISYDIYFYEIILPVKDVIKNTDKKTASLIKRSMKDKFLDYIE